MNNTELLKKAKNITELLLAKSERDFNTTVTKNQLMTQPIIVGSWGAHNWKNIGNTALLFQVNGRLHKGIVAIVLGFEDLYKVFLLDEELNFSPTILESVYAEDLVLAIDAIVETPQKDTEESRLAQIDNAKKYLESQGFFTANLWHTDDVCQNYDDVNQDEALNIIEDAMTSNWMISQIFEAIDIVAEENGYKRKDED